MYRWHQTKFAAMNKGLVSKEPTGLRRWSTPGGGSHMKGTGMLVGKLELNP